TGRGCSFCELKPWDRAACRNSTLYHSRLFYNGCRPMRAIAIIPARLGSTRLPRKVLREIAGRPMLAWVYEAARSSPLVADVIVATDSQDVIDACQRNGWS